MLTIIARKNVDNVELSVKIRYNQYRHSLM